MKIKLLHGLVCLLIFFNIFFIRLPSIANAAVSNIERADTVSFLRKWYPKLTQTSSLNVRGVHVGLSFVSDLSKKNESNEFLQINDVNDDYATLFVVCDEDTHLYILDFEESLACNSNSLEQKFEIFNFYYYFNKSPSLYLLDYKDGPTNIIILPRSYIAETKYQASANDYFNYKSQLDKKPTIDISQKEIAALNESSIEFRNNMNYLAVVFVIIVALIIFDRKRSILKTIYLTVLEFYNKNFSLNLYIMYVMFMSFLIICAMLYIKFEGNLDYSIFLLVFKSNNNLTDLRLVPSAFLLFIFMPIAFTNLSFLGFGSILKIIKKHESLEDSNINEISLQRLAIAINIFGLPASLYMGREKGLITLIVIIFSNLFINFYTKRKFNKELFPIPYLVLYLAILTLLIVFL